MPQSREKAIASFAVNPCKSHFLRRPEFSWSRQPNAGANWRELPPLAAVLTRIEFPFSEILLNCGPCARRPLPFQGKTESSLRRDCDVLSEAPRPPPCKALKTCVSEGKFLGFIWPPPSISCPGAIVDENYQWLSGSVRSDDRRNFAPSGRCHAFPEDLLP